MNPSTMMGANTRAYTRTTNKQLSQSIDMIQVGEAQRLDSGSMETCSDESPTVRGSDAAVGLQGAVLQTAPIVKPSLFIESFNKQHDS